MGLIKAALGSASAKRAAPHRASRSAQTQTCDRESAYSRTTSSERAAQVQSSGYPALQDNRHTSKTA